MTDILQMAILLLTFVLCLGAGVFLGIFGVLMVIQKMRKKQLRESEKRLTETLANLQQSFAAQVEDGKKEKTTLN